MSSSISDESIRMAMVLTPAYSDDGDYQHWVRMGRAVLRLHSLELESLIRKAIEYASTSYGSQFDGREELDQALALLNPQATAPGQPASPPPQ